MTQAEQLGTPVTPEQLAAINAVRAEQAAQTFGKELALLAEFAKAHPDRVAGFDSYTTATEHVATVRFDRSTYWEWRNALASTAAA